MRIVGKRLDAQLGRIDHLKHQFARIHDHRRQLGLDAMTPLAGAPSVRPCRRARSRRGRVRSGCSLRFRLLFDLLAGHGPPTARAAADALLRER